jgi:hypothetical protein
MLVVCGVAAGSLAAAAVASAAPTVCATGCRYTSIQTAINAAAPKDVITIGAGSYFENLTVNKPLTLKGEGMTRTIVYPGVSKPVCSGGSLCGGEASNIILVEANEVTIQSMWLKGDNPNLTSGVVVGGEDIDARNGVITNHLAGTYNNLTVAKTKVTGVYLRGIYASSGGSFNFNHDTVENVQGEEASIAMFDFEGSGVMASNKVLNANDAISANWSKGTQFLSNSISKSGSGVHTDNNGGSGGTADLIKGNVVKACKSNGYGVFVFVPYVSATVEANKVTGCAIGLAAYGGAVSGQGPSFVKNVVNGTGAAATGTTYGAYLTTDQVGFGFGDMTAKLEGNSLTHFGTGMFVTQSNPTAGQPAGGQATVTATPNNVFEANGTGATGEPGTKVNARNDFWGCASGPNKGGKCQTVTGTVEYAPWLTSHP